MKASSTIFCLCCAIIFLNFSPAQAISDTLSASQIQEAVEFGRTNHGSIEKILDSLYSCCGDSRDLIIRTKWCKIALIAGIKAHEGKDISAHARGSIMEDPTLQIDIIVTGPTIEFARSYTASVVQNSKKIYPDQLHADHFQSGGNHQKIGSLSGYYAVIRTYFKYADLDVTKPFSLVLAKPGGTQEYKIDPAKYK